ncbi:S-adenosyl-L-methionine-dependent methyltransferase [Gigaspora rosea]|uniref:S-adenosyl-L-methionine-dependent methyltransferase n=1 Tax=Gigaspora rosea TaxID=44941 RepID=A0A397UR08_9GLOM|nr:S-adenosyl-L-methionine-dependent methyltransferase [Gigaspora rosea]CAG8450385.1 7503_t:CDS:2 [Gigaspora rosea]
MGNHHAKNSVCSTIKPSTTSYRYVDGRRFQNIENTRYPMPDDDEELDRLQRQHFLFRYLWESNFSAPIDEILRDNKCEVLDVGCGPGAWLMELAHDYPRSNFTGIDLVAAFPSQIKPPNTTFIQGNALNGLPFPDNFFDFVHMRLLVSSFSESEWETVISELVRVTKPNGWIELCETDFRWFNDGPMSKKLTMALRQMTESRGAISIVTPLIHNILKNNPSLTNLQDEHRELPFGSWAGRLGEIANEECLVGALSGLSAELSPIMNVSQEEYANILKSLGDEMTNYKAFSRNHRIYARKF